MSTFFKCLIRQKTALVHNDDILLMSSSKQQILQLIKHIHDFAKKWNLKKGFKKSIFTTVTEI